MSSLVQNNSFIRDCILFPRYFHITSASQFFQICKEYCIVLDHLNNPIPSTNIIHSRFGVFLLETRSSIKTG